MKTHHRLRAACAGRRSTIFRCRSAIVIALTGALLVTACGSDQAADQALTTPPVSQEADDIVSETVEAMAELDDSADDTAADTPDYTDEELEVLLDVQEPDEVVDPEDAEPEPLDAESPAAAIEAVETALDDAPAAGATPILDRVEPIDEGATGTIFGIRDGRRINEAGEANRLDEAAALACGNVEIALTSLDEGRPDEAATRMRTASTMAAETAVPAMTEWVPVLDQAAADVAVDGSAGGVAALLIAFLTTCTQGGYEL